MQNPVLAHFISENLLASLLKIVHALSKLEHYKEQVKELYGVELTTQPTVRYMTLDEAKHKT